MANSHSALSALLRLDREPAALWQESELAAILQHQFVSPLEFDLASFDAAASRRCFQRTPAWRARSFGALFHEPATDLDLLELVKEFAKASATEHALPAPVAAVLYLLSIGAALVHCRGRITELRDDQLREKIDWAVTQPWLDKESRRLLEQAAALLTSGERK